MGLTVVLTVAIIVAFSGRAASKSEPVALYQVASAETGVGDGGADALASGAFGKTARRGSHEISSPDQPGWKSHIDPDYYGLNSDQMAHVAGETAILGVPQGDEAVQSLDSFVLAAVFSPCEETDPLNKIDEVVSILREAKILSFAAPLALWVPEVSKKSKCSGSNVGHWVGIPVPVGTDVPKPLVAIDVPGGQVVAETDLDSESFDDWRSLSYHAKTIGYQPSPIRVLRYQGWGQEHSELRLHAIQLLM